MKRDYGRVFHLLLWVLLLPVLSGCQIIEVFQATPVPLETPTPRLSLYRITEIPTLQPFTATPTLAVGDQVRYTDPDDVFLKVTEEQLPDRPFQSVIIFGTVGDPYIETDEWGMVRSTGGFQLNHHSGTEFHVSCDDYCFAIDARRHLYPTDKIEKGAEVIIFGATDEEVTDVNADLIAVHTLISTAGEKITPDPAIFPSDMTYTEYELFGFPSLNPISVDGILATATPIPTATPDAEATATTAAETGYDTGYDYSYYYNPYYLPTSTPNRPDPTATPTQDLSKELTPEPTEVPETLNDRLKDRLNHTLASRTNYIYGAYGEKYSAYVEYNQEQNRDPRHPTRASMEVESNDYPFHDFWFPYVENPMYINWGVLCYGGDWYLPIRMSVDIDPNPGVTDIVFTDRTIRSQQSFDKQQGYLRSFGYSIIDSKFFYFYQKENGFGISINRQDYDLGFDDIPFGYIGKYTEINPFYSDDLITFFGHRDGKWYYVELRKNNNMNTGYYGW